MRKKNLLAVTLMVLCVGLMACGGKEKEAETQAQTQQEQQKAETGYVFENKGLTMNIDGNVTDYVAKLGELRAVLLKVWTSSGTTMDLLYRDIRRVVQSWCMP